MSPEYLTPNTIEYLDALVLRGELKKKLTNNSGISKSIIDSLFEEKVIKRSKFEFSTKSGIYKIWRDNQHYHETIELKKVGQGAEDVDNQNNVDTTVSLTLSYNLVENTSQPSDLLPPRANSAKITLNYNVNGKMEKNPKEALQLASEFVKSI